MEDEIKLKLNFCTSLFVLHVYTVLLSEFLPFTQRMQAYPGLLL